MLLYFKKKHQMLEVFVKINVCGCSLLFKCSDVVYGFLVNVS
jgi:hypothetical protein